MTAITALRRLLTAGWAVAVFGLIGLAVWSHLASPIIVAGTSMEPAIPIGSVVMPGSSNPDEIRIDDVVTVVADNGVMITHRVTRVVDVPEGRFFELKGDANPRPDPALVPVRAVVGRIDTQLPYVGYPLSFLAMPSGIVSLAAALGTLLIAIWLIEDLERGARSAAVAPGAARTPHGASA